MTRELVPVGDELHLLDPASGETVALTAATADLIGEVIAAIDDSVRDARDARRALGAELIRRMDHELVWTIRAAGRKFTAPSTKPETEWNIELLITTLADLVERDVISRDASLRACEPRTEWVTIAAGLNALEKDPEIAAVLALCKTSVPKGNRSVRVERG